MYVPLSAVVKRVGNAVVSTKLTLSFYRNQINVHSYNQFITVPAARRPTAPNVSPSSTLAGTLVTHSTCFSRKGHHHLMNTSRNLLCSMVVALRGKEIRRHDRHEMTPPLKMSATVSKTTNENKTSKTFELKDTK